ncbi:putative VQ motif-containing protein/18/20/21/25 [Helianthus anomalus]
MCTMEDMMSNKTNHTCSSTSKPLTMHKDSRIISKIKPKIRIIHIFAPEIIKTDVANFRELVQRLTGKPTEKKKPKTRKESHKRLNISPVGLEVREKIKGEEEIWVGANSGGGFLGGFGDLDGFMQEFTQHNHGFAAVIPTLDAPTLVNSHLEYGFGERPLNFPTYS